MVMRKDNDNEKIGTRRRIARKKNDDFDKSDNRSNEKKVLKTKSSDSGKKVLKTRGGKSDSYRERNRDTESNMPKKVLRTSRRESDVEEPRKRRTDSDASKDFFRGKPVKKLFTKTKSDRIERTDRYAAKKNDRVSSSEESRKSSGSVIRKRKLAENEEKALRLNKYIANAGICSRREADEYIKAGWLL
jgi:23S rRNA pseudouridine2605 synthase